MLARNGIIALALTLVPVTSVTTVPMGAPATAIGITPDAHLALVTLLGSVAGCLGAAQAPAAQAAAAQAPRVLPRQSVSPGHIAAINIATNQRLPGLFPAIDTNPVAIAIKPDGTGAYVVTG